MPSPSDRLSPQPGQLKVMISSTTLDLPSHRKAVEDAILRAGCFPLAIEHGSATSNSDAIRLSLEMVDQGDIYVGIFAQRYGFIPDKENPQRWSVTEHEYRRAVAREIPRLLYLADKEHKFTVEEIDLDPEKQAKLQALRKEIETQEICGFFSSPEKLHSLVVQSLFKEKEKQGTAIAAEPRAKVSIPRPPDIYAVPPYTLTNTFVGRRAELSELDSWAASPDPVMVVEAIGGMGKSALTWEWTQQHAEALIPDLAGRVWWSFYERGTSMKTFLRHALAYVTRQDPEALVNLDTYDSSQQLLAELKRRPYLLVLDGFERVLTAYHRMDKAQLPDDQVPADKRECTNPKDGDVLRQLVHCGPSKLLVSTRLMPKPLEDRHTHQPIPGVLHLELEGLAPDDALKMMQHAGIRGDEDAILRFADQFGRHALLLQIVSGMITDYRPKPFDFDAWRADPYAGGGLKLSELPLKQRYTHILEYAFRGLAEKHRQLLSRIAVLSDSADYATIAALNPFSSSNRDKDLIEFHRSLSDLEDRGLLQWDRETNTYDMHPVVRAFAFEQLEERDRTQTYNTIHDHFASLPPENILEAIELTQVKNSIEILRALIGAKRIEEALDFYRGALSRSLLFSIGAYHIVVEIVGQILQYNRSNASIAADNEHWGYLLNSLAIALDDLQKSEDAIPLYLDAARLALKARQWHNCVAAVRNLALSKMHLNQLALGNKIHKLCCELNYSIDDKNTLAVLTLDKITEATGLGRFEEAQQFLSFFQQQFPLPSHVIRPGSAEFCFANLRFHQGTLTVGEIDHIEQIAIRGRNLTIRHRSVALRAEWELLHGNPTAALDSVEQALSIARRIGKPTPDYLGTRALALARLGRSAEARETLAEAEDAWNGRTPQCPLRAAETWQALGESSQARKFVQQAYPLAWADGPPYINWYELKRCRELMAELGEPEPQLPPFDPAKVEPIPFEAEIQAAIERLKAERAKKTDE